MARNHQSREDFEEMGFRSRSRSHLFLNEFETSVGGFYSLRRNHRDHPYVSDVVDTLSDQFSFMSLLHPKPRPIPALSSSLQVISFFLCFITLLHIFFTNFMFLFWCGFFSLL